jgi:hypothetical protein
LSQAPQAIILSQVIWVLVVSACSLPAAGRPIELKGKTHGAGRSRSNECVCKCTLIYAPFAHAAWMGGSLCRHDPLRRSGGHDRVRMSQIPDTPPQASTAHLMSANRPRGATNSSPGYLSRPAWPSWQPSTQIPRRVVLFRPVWPFLSSVRMVTRPHQPRSKR